MYTPADLKFNTANVIAAFRNLQVSFLSFRLLSFASERVFRQFLPLLQLSLPAKHRALRSSRLPLRLAYPVAFAASLLNIMTGLASDLFSCPSRFSNAGEPYEWYVVLVAQELHSSPFSQEFASLMSNVINATYETARFDPLWDLTGVRIHALYHILSNQNDLSLLGHRHLCIHIR